MHDIFGDYREHFFSNTIFISIIDIIRMQCARKKIFLTHSKINMGIKTPFDHVDMTGNIMKKKMY